MEAEKKTTTTRRAAPVGEARAKKARVVKQILERVEAKLAKDVEKASLGDYIKLVQLEKELEEEGPKEITVTWVEPTDASEE
jgi:hypothetical protein